MLNFYWRNASDVAIGNVAKMWQVKGNSVLSSFTPNYMQTPDLMKMWDVPETDSHISPKRPLENVDIVKRVKASVSDNTIINNDSIECIVLCKGANSATSQNDIKCIGAVMINNTLTWSDLINLIKAELDVFWNIFIAGCKCWGDC